MTGDRLVPARPQGLSDGLGHGRGVDRLHAGDVAAAAEQAALAGDVSHDGSTERTVWSRPLRAGRTD